MQDNSELFNLKILYQNLTFLFPDMKWFLYSDHVHSNYRKLDIQVCIHRPEGADHSEFFLNYMDKYFKICDRSVMLLKSFDQLERQLRALENMTKTDQMLLELNQTW
jgi:hypothetical protein